MWCMHAEQYSSVLFIWLLLLTVPSFDTFATFATDLILSIIETIAKQ